MASAAVASADCIGPYRAIRQLGAGGMGEVFLAHDDDLGRNIAIKLLPPHLADDAEHLGRLRNEARSASSLNHPNIVTIYEIGRDDSKRAFMAMEYVDGQTLREVLRGDALPVRKALQIATQIADGLAAAHKRGLVHRDLKPENIMLTTDGVVKILDFGLAKSFATTNSDMSEPGMLVGTYSYMSPEQARAGEIDYRSDQFSFGSILYEMLTGTRAFDGSSGVETLFMVVRDEPASLSNVASHVPAPLRWIVDRCLSKDPEDRYVSTRDLARDLQYLRDHFSEAGTATPIRENDSVATRIRKRWPVAAAIVFALVARSLITAWVQRPEPRTITSERYLTYSGHDFSPAVSPDGKLIAFASSRDGEQRIWLKQVAGGSEVALTAGSDDFPRFSPDSSAILYIHTDGTALSLWRIPAVGGEARKILDDVASADFSRDGKRIAFLRNVTRGVARTDLWVADADGSHARLLAGTDVGASHPRWSPDGKQIAIVTPKGGRVMQSVMLFDATTGAPKALATPPKAGEVSSVVWTADGRHVLYVRAESVEAVVGSSAKVVRHDIRSDALEVIGWSSHNGVMLDLLGDGRVVLDARSPRDNLRELGQPDKATETASEKWITRGNSSDRQPAYAPDGKAVLFTSNRSGNLDLWLTTSDGGVRRLTDDASEDWDPAFTPDGKSIVWSSGRSGNLEIWIANADGSGARQISADGLDAENPSATPDGKWIVYCSFNPQKAGIWKVRSDGTQATHLVKARTSLPEISPDGQYITYLADSRTARAHIRVVRVADGKDMGMSIPVRTFSRTGAILGRSRWMPDGKAIAFLGQTEEGINGVFVQDFVPGRDTSATKRQLGGFDAERATESFGIAPDGKTLTVAGWEQLFSIFSIEGLPLQKKES